MLTFYLFKPVKESESESESVVLDVEINDVDVVNLLKAKKSQTALVFD